MFGLITLPAGGVNNAFYESWADYLQPKSRMFLSVLQTMFQGLADIFYDLANAVLTAWSAAWKLADFSSLFTDAKEANDMTGYQLVQYTGLFFTIGLIIMSIMMAVQLVQFNLTSGRRGKEWPAGIVTAVIIIALVPMLISGGTAVAKSMNSTLLGDNTDTAQNGGHSILTDVWKNNSVDLKKVAQANFNVDEKHIHDYSPVKNNSSNAIVKSSIFTSVIDDDDKKDIKGKEAKKVFDNKQGEESKTEKMDKGGWIKGSEDAYPRVKVNWMGIIAAEIVFAIVGFLAIIELIVRFFRLAYYSLTLLALAFRDMEGKKAMQILHLMEGSILGLALLPLNVILFFAFVQWGMNAINNQSLSWGPYTVVSVALLLAAGKGLLSGFALIDDWTGTPSGHGGTVTSLIGAGAAVAGVGRSANGAVAAPFHGAAKVGRGATKAGEKTVNGAKSIKDKVAQARKRGDDTQNDVQGGKQKKSDPIDVGAGSTSSNSGAGQQVGKPSSSGTGNKSTTNNDAHQSKNATGIPTTSINQSANQEIHDNDTRQSGAVNESGNQQTGSRTPADAHNPGIQPGRPLTSGGNLSGSQAGSKNGGLQAISQTTGSSLSNESLKSAMSPSSGSNDNSTVPVGMSIPTNTPSSSPSNPSGAMSSNTSNNPRPSSNSPKSTQPTTVGNTSQPGNPVNTTVPAGNISNRVTNSVTHTMSQQQNRSTDMPNANPSNRSTNSNYQSFNPQSNPRPAGNPGITQDSRFSQSRQSKNNSQSQYSRLQKELQNDFKKAYPKTDTNQQRTKKS
ncbi:pLS20_p028 family conjugation system transmembrane protein [Weissella paramesenteroides]|uniref:pLS20_p028 family conjugation system transmembrane protein n=1 Tax=Weissella paramesenteroides TaxID=1249 RepID=UPI00388EE527